MKSVDDRIAPRARKNHTAILSALAETGQSEVAKMIGESDATISRFKADLERCAAIMAAVGLKVVPQDARFLSESRVRSLCEMAALGVESIEKETSEWGSL